MPGDLAYKRIHKFLSEIANSYSSRGVNGEAFNIDLTRFELIDPLSIVVLLNLCYCLEETNVFSTINVSENLFPLDEFKNELEYLKIKTAKGTEDSSKELIKIFHLKPKKCREDIYLRKIKEDVENWVSNNGFSDKQMLYAKNFIKEMLNNVNIHSKSKYCSLVLQVIKLSCEQTGLVVAIGDNGIGIRRSLTEYPERVRDNSVNDLLNLKTIGSDIEALQFTVDEGISRLSQGGAGLNGFATLSKEQNADFIIHSGTGIYGIVGKAAMTNDIKHHLKGTSVCLVLYPM